MTDFNAKYLNIIIHLCLWAGTGEGPVAPPLPRAPRSGDSGKGCAPALPAGKKTGDNGEGVEAARQKCQNVAGAVAGSGRNRDRAQRKCGGRAIIDRCRLPSAGSEDISAVSSGKRRRPRAATP